MKLNMQLMGYINIFEKVTRAKVKDCFFDKQGVVVFIVKPGFIGKAIGKKGANVKKLSDSFKKKIKIIEFDDDVCKFVKNCLFPLKCDVEKEENNVIIKCETKQDKGKIIGRERANLNALNELVKKFFDVNIVVN